MKKTIAEEYGLQAGQYIKLTYERGVHRGEQFTGKIGCDVQINYPLYLENEGDITANITSIFYESGKIIILTKLNARCSVEFITEAEVSN